MDSDGKSRGLSRTSVAVALMAVGVASGLASFLLLKMSAPPCAQAPAALPPPPAFPSTLSWARGERVALEDSAYDLYVARLGAECYLLPKGGAGAQGRTLIVAAADLAPELVEELGGMAAYLACKGGRTGLLRAPTTYEVEAGRREKRQAMTDEERERRMQGLALSRAEREPRCMDTFIDCGTQVGMVNKCYTGLNGIFLMERECLSPTQFQSRMVKPPGRILKILQKQMIECIEYKRVNAEQGRAVRC